MTSRDPEKVKVVTPLSLTVGLIVDVVVAVGVGVCV